MSTHFVTRRLEKAWHPAILYVDAVTAIQHHEYWVHNHCRIVSRPVDHISDFLSFFLCRSKRGSLSMFCLLSRNCPPTATVTAVCRLPASCLSPRLLCFVAVGLARAVPNRTESPAPAVKGLVLRSGGYPHFRFRVYVTRTSDSVSGSVYHIKIERTYRLLSQST